MALRGNPQDPKRFGDKVRKAKREVPKLALAAADALRPVVADAVSSGQGANGESWPGATDARVAEIASRTKVSATASNKVFVRYRGVKGGTAKLHGLTPWPIVPGKGDALPDAYRQVIDRAVHAAFAGAMR